MVAQHTTGSQQASERCWILVGPTAVGKTELSLALAHERPVEIVSVDSMQVYRGMDIGTAKPRPEELLQTPHHMIDVVEPQEQFSVGRFCRMADESIRGIRGRGNRPLMLCGTPLYLKGILWGLFDGPEADPDLRRRLRTEAQRLGVAALHRRLAEVDAATARRVDPNDLVRIERALEVYELTGRRISEMQSQFDGAPRMDYVAVGLRRERPELYERIERRVDTMMAAGLLEEVRGLMGRLGPQAAQAVGYKELACHLRGEMSLADAVALVKRNTRRLAKHQMTWLRRLPQVAWLDLAAGARAAEALAGCERVYESLDATGVVGYD